MKCWLTICFQFFRLFRFVVYLWHFSIINKFLRKTRPQKRRTQFIVRDLVAIHKYASAYFQEIMWQSDRYNHVRPDWHAYITWIIIINPLTPILLKKSYFHIKILYNNIANCATESRVCRLRLILFTSKYTALKFLFM